MAEFVKRKADVRGSLLKDSINFYRSEYGSGIDEGKSEVIFVTLWYISQIYYH